ncbi:hypothetical protein CEUSTIGMA_g13699.t1 [Chlamydomonas eustigma]|uniref:TIR domain-containing protein n=1 Tax=Chlamydomonas eustigma TaxID=1157962 RepID=A0A250XT93_9CHLO|nr:hypothetical protein CEUSTIGMA_g13699.t1 [Chlamydomonas eustigma]|eukprot:GAX86287.1 hypothetical protein CEUSTIGMA_g13699.t1 [Chlamydomonas eustigma]
MSKEVCFSARTSQIPYVKNVASALEERGIRCFFQNDICLTGSHWQNQWFKAASEAAKIVCVLTSDYPLSEPCCKEFLVAENKKTLLVIYKDPVTEIQKCKVNDHNGAVLMYVDCGYQGLPPDDIQFVASEIFKAVRGTNMNATTAAGLEKGMAAVSIHQPGALLAAAKAGNLIEVKDLLDKGADKEAKDKNGSTALHGAAENGHKDVVALLIEKGADKEAKNDSGLTALHWAALNGHKDVVALLIEKGANKEADALSFFGNGCTALHGAAANGRKDVVALLIEKGANMEAKDKDEQTALHGAARYGSKDVVALLIEKGADKEAKDKDEQTALHGAARYGRKYVVALLIEKGADKEAKDKLQRTALHWAVKEGHKDVEALLLKRVPTNRP